MLDESTRNAIALVRFSLISPVINGHVENHRAYYIEVTDKPIEMPHYGLRKYSPKTVESWYFEYMKGGLEAIKPSVRGDKGQHRTISDEISKLILEKRKQYPKAAKSVIYDMLLKSGSLKHDTISASTFYRFLRNIK